jgi:hypothetical protein
MEKHPLRTVALYLHNYGRNLKELLLKQVFHCYRGVVKGIEEERVEFLYIYKMNLHSCVFWDLENMDGSWVKKCEGYKCDVISRETREPKTRRNSFLANWSS